LQEVFLRIEKQLLIAANAFKPRHERKQPDTFCFVLLGRKSRSAWLFVNGAS
jgi:hypothetical protein